MVDVIASYPEFFKLVIRDRGGPLSGLHLLVDPVLLAAEVVMSNSGD